MSGRPKHPKYARNKNVIVIGGSGSGKTRFYVKPNLMQMPQKVSYVVTDPKGTIIIECGKIIGWKKWYKKKNTRLGERIQENLLDQAGISFHRNVVY